MLHNSGTNYALNERELEIFKRGLEAVLNEIAECAQRLQKAVNGDPHLAFALSDLNDAAQLARAGFPRIFRMVETSRREDDLPF